MRRSLPIIVAATLAFALSARADTITGKVTHVRDGDTIVVSTPAGAQPVRLNGVDAPELSDMYGYMARNIMISIADGKTVVCILDGSTTYDRKVGVCRLASTNQDIGAEIIRAGYALDCRRFSKGRYKDDETYGAKLMLKRAPYCKEQR